MATMDGCNPRAFRMLRQPPQSIWCNTPTSNGINIIRKALRPRSFDSANRGMSEYEANLND